MAPVEFAPVFLIWMALLLAPGLATFAALVSFAWLHDRRTTPE